MFLGQDLVTLGVQVLAPDERVFCRRKLVQAVIQVNLQFGQTVPLRSISYQIGLRGEGQALKENEAYALIPRAKTCFCKMMPAGFRFRTGLPRTSQKTNLPAGDNE